MEIENYSLTGKLINFKTKHSTKLVILDHPLSYEEFAKHDQFNMLDYYYFNNEDCISLYTSVSSSVIGDFPKPQKDLDDIRPYLLKESEKLIKKHLMDLTFSHTNAINKLANAIEL